MRMAFILALAAGALVLAPKSASAFPSALADQATASRQLVGTAVEQASRRAHARRYYKHYAYTGRRYNWTYYPYWRPYQYRYWQFYYPYGGPLF